MIDETTTPADAVVEATTDATETPKESVEGPLEVQLKPKKPFKPRKPREEVPAVVRAPEHQDRIDAIKSMTSKKHIKIWLLHAELLTNKEVATELGTNSGHINNEVKRYIANPELIAAALALKPAPAATPE